MEAIKQEEVQEITNLNGLHPIQLFCSINRILRTMIRIVLKMIKTTMIIKLNPVVHQAMTHLLVNMKLKENLV